MTESLPRFLLAWVLMNTAPAVVLPPFWLRAVSTHDSSEDLVAGMLALIGIVSFLVLSGVGNWLFMRHRGPHPIAWGMMTTAGAIIGVVSVGFVIYQGYDSVSLWYLKTGRALIDPSWPTDEVVDDIVAAIAGLSFGLFLGVAQALSLTRSFGPRILWASTCGVASMFAAIAGSLMDGRPLDVVAAMGLGDQSADAWYWLLALSAFSSTVLLLYALPTGLVLWHLQKRARLAQSNVLISRFD